MPEPLVCEDTSLTRLMETVQKTPGARILYQDTVRRGGVLGFFAREVHRVAYIADERPEDAADRPPTKADAVSDSTVSDGTVSDGTVSDGTVSDSLSDSSRSVDGTSAQSPIESLLASAEAAEASLRTGQPDFASVLRQYVAEPEPSVSAANTELRSVSEPNGPDAVPQPMAQPTAGPSQPMAEVTSLSLRGRDARTRLELLMQLRQVGVPISLNPGTGVRSPYEALEDILDQLPAPAELPTGPGQLIVLAGEGAAAVRAARVVCRMLRLKLGSIIAAGVDSGIGGPLRRISSPAEAALLREELAAIATPSVLVIGTDGAGLGPDDPWPAAMINALRPAAVWGVVDARWKNEDCQAQLARLPRADALAVHSAEFSASPASVWELELPIGLLDDRRPSTFIWLGMLIRLLGGSPRHRASA
jgi:hypothetical protein